MKNKSKLIGAALAIITAIAITAGQHKVKADQPILQPHQKVEVAILTFRYDYSGPDIIALVESITVSSGLDRVAIGSNAAEAISHYKSLNTIIDFASPVQVIMTTPLRDQPATRTTPLLQNY